MMAERTRTRKSAKDKQKRPVEHDDRIKSRDTGRREDLREESDDDRRQDDGEQPLVSVVSSEEEEKNESAKQEREVEKPAPKQEDKRQSDFTDGTKSVTDNTLINILIVVSMVAVFVLAMVAALSRSNNLKNSSNNIDIELSLKQLKSDFENQPESSFKKLKSRMVPYIKHRTSPQPFVLLVASVQDNQPAADCFARRVTQLLTTTSHVTIDGSKYLNKTSDDTKSEIDEQLRNVFSKGKFPTAAIINNFDMIPYGSTNLFYAYCDHDNPMYEEAAIILTITLPQDYHIDSKELEREKLVEKYLSEDSRWVKDEAFNSDVMGALISRITDTVIVINEESIESLGKSCSAK